MPMLKMTIGEKRSVDDVIGARLRDLQFNRHELMRSGSTMLKTEIANDHSSCLYVSPP